MLAGVAALLLGVGPARILGLRVTSPSPHLLIDREEAAAAQRSDSFAHAEHLLPQGSLLAAEETSVAEQRTPWRRKHHRRHGWGATQRHASATNGALGDRNATSSGDGTDLSDASACKRMRDLEVAMREMKTRDMALESWCGPAWATEGCPVCVDVWGAEQTHPPLAKPLYLRIASDGDMVLGGPGEDEYCASFYITDMRARLTYLDATTHDFCRDSFTGRVVSNTVLQFLAAVGVKTMDAGDVATFAMDCADFSASFLKVLTTGETFYQRYYKDSFTFANQEACPSLKRALYDTGLKQTAGLVLHLTQTADSNADDCRQATMLYDTLKHMVRDSDKWPFDVDWSEKWREAKCQEFVVDVPKAVAALRPVIPASVQRTSDLLALRRLRSD